MSSLFDSIDRFSFTAKEIHSASLKTACTPSGPFARAVLKTQLGDLARDADASELGLFTVVPQGPTSNLNDDPDALSTVQKNDIARVEFLGATPLRKPAPGRRGATEVKEKDPEVYAEAALKYIEKYQSIRPMPRAHQEVTSLLARLSTLRDEIDALSSAAAASDNAQPSTSTAPTVKDEERKIQELNLRIKQLKARKDVLLKKKRLDSRSASSTNALQSDTEETVFWDEPAARPTRSVRSKARQSLVLPSSSGGGDDSLLLESNMDLGDLSIDSIGDVLSSPVKVPSAPPSRLQPPAQNSTNKFSERASFRRPPVQTQKSIPKLPYKPPPPSERSPVHDNSDKDKQEKAQHQAVPDVDVDDEDDEKTIVLRKVSTSLAESISSSAPTSPTQPTSTHEPHSFNPPATPSQNSASNNDVPPSTGRKPKTRINVDTERIVAKIWSTVGDIIMPGHRFNTAAAATSNKPPKAKETIALLQNLSLQTATPSSPSTHSTLSLAEPSNSGQPTVQQILIAHLLFSLLTTPNYAMSLSKAKEVLAAKDIGQGQAGGFNSLALGIGAQALESRALYTCIAKRLIKIDRSTTEQTVRFVD